MDIFNKKIKPVNRRSEPRYCLPNLAAYTDEGAECREKIVNVSMNGCCIETPVKLLKGEHALIHFITSANYYAIDDSFCLDGCVAWRTTGKNGDYHYGFLFSEPRSQFFQAETQAFREQIAHMACQQYITNN